MQKSDKTPADHAVCAVAMKRIGDCIRRRGTVLDLSDLGLTSIPAKITQLEKLTALDLSKNRLSTLPPEIRTHIHLTRLNLSHNPLGLLSSDIGRFVNLNFLDLSHTTLDTLPQEIGSLTALTRLHLNNNLLHTLPPEIGRLVNLTRLFLSHNRLENFPPELDGLVKLTRLDISNNLITTLDPTIQHHAGLTVLDLSHNPLACLPEEIGRLVRLSALYLSACSLESLPSEIGDLANLTELDLTGNSLATLPESLKNLENLERLFLHDNPDLQLSPCILGADPRMTQDQKFPPAKSILEFHFGRHSGKSRPLNEVKLILLGRSGAGKTSIVQAMRDHPFHERESATTGASLCDWIMEGSGDQPVTAHVWDFSGDPATHPLHPLFFSPKNLYILVLTGRDRHEHDDAEYWLRLIESSATDTRGRCPPVIVALNQWNVPDCRPEPDRIALRDQYPFIRGFVEMDCKGKKGIPALKSALFKELDRMPWVREPFLGEWDAVRRSLASEKSLRKHLTEEEYRTLCAGHGITDEGQQDYLAEVLHHLGIAPNHRNDPRLPDSMTLNPEWLMKHLYPLLHRAKILAGLLKQSDVDIILANENSLTGRACLMQVLENFRIAFSGQGKSERAWLLPHAQSNTVPNETSDFHDAKDAIRLRYGYQTPSEDLLPRIIARRHEFIEESAGHKLQWRHGAILSRKDARALIHMEPQLHCLSITVTGPVKLRHQLADLCQAEMHELHAGASAPTTEIQINGEWASNSWELPAPSPLSDLGTTR